MHMEPTRRSSAFRLVALLCLSLTAAASAQVLGRSEGRRPAEAGYYLLALPDEPTTRVVVRGDVPRAGIYDLGRGFGFDLANLLAVAGDPAATVELDPRGPRVRVRLRRGGSHEVVYQADYEDLVAGESPAPSLVDGDVVVVETLYERGVYVWGAVREPGYFEVGPEVDPVRLLALAGGPQGDGARAETVATDATVALIRPGQGVVYQASLEDFVIGTDVPALVDGDALQVEVVQRNRLTFRDGLSIVGSVAAIASGVIAVVVTLTRSNS